MLLSVFLSLVPEYSEELNGLGWEPYAEHLREIRDNLSYANQSEFSFVWLAEDILSLVELSGIIYTWSAIDWERNVSRIQPI
jgi:hypothetical protein